ncbi:hypothetical protein B9Z55_011945 [Caenorhabditis nigoni]|uniref:Uncharacterized protein n=1 Tax=Caenorhabditis nigoni TaxID=1611254 RepID=A0A2G5TV44_9PELO|nr:hypothetical protein B9Z55_011945 [Caenorhabditis nigoni]
MHTYFCRTLYISKNLLFDDTSHKNRYMSSRWTILVELYLSVYGIYVIGFLYKEDGGKLKIRKTKFKMQEGNNKRGKGEYIGEHEKVSQ